MFEFFKKLFSRQETPNSDDFIEEFWETEFDSVDHGRFPVVEGGDYRTGYGKNLYQFTLDHPDLFAWVFDPLYQYEDFAIETDFRFAPETVHGAAGFAFRGVNEENFYYLLISNTGYWRFDAVFNGAPRPLAAWTEIQNLPSREAFRLKLLARGNRFTVLINEEWAGEIEDDTFSRGRIGFALQNYHETPNLSVNFLGIELESRAIEVETLWYQWNSAIPVNPEARLALAETYMASNEWLKAAVQLKKAALTKIPTPDEHFFLAETYIHLSLWQEALEALDAALAKDPNHLRSLMEKANVLYLSGRFLDLREWLSCHEAEFAEDAMMLNLRGHAEYNLGNYEAAADCYARSSLRDPEVALFSLNAARSYEHWDHEKALSYYSEAARLFFRDGNYDDCREILPKIATLDPIGDLTDALEGKMAWHAGDFQKAERIFSSLMRSETQDSAVWFLSAQMLSGRGEYAKAQSFFEKACALEPGYAPYWFRLAETLHLAGKNPDSALETALTLDPESGWTLNLAGQIALGRKNLTEAAAWLEKAHAALPFESAPAVNQSELLFLTGKLDEAIASLSQFSGSASAQNQKGNIFSRSGDVETAVEAYREAVSLDPDNREYRLNLAAACIESDLFSEAEDALGTALDSGSDARSCLLSGNLAEIFGDRVRAETAFRLGLELAPNDPDLHAALAANYLNRMKYDKATQEIAVLREISPGERVENLERRLLDATSDRLFCASCKREWRTPRPLPNQKGFKAFAEPPDESPAGQCPECGDVFCVGCRKDHLEDDRFTCPSCGVALKLNDDRLKYLVLSYLEKAVPTRSQIANE